MTRAVLVAAVLCAGRSGHQTEELITRLGQIERLHFKSRTAVQRYRGRAVEDPASLGRSRPGCSRCRPNRAITIP